MKRTIVKTILLFCLLFQQLNGASQPNVSGPVCAMAGTVYQYVISGAGGGAFIGQVCITGGRIIGSDGNDIFCTVPDSAVSKVMVIWNDSLADDGVLNLSSAAGNASLSVYFAGSLQPGIIDSICKTQIIFNTQNSIMDITCSPDSGGSCTPSYGYQWQHTSDMFNWADIPGAVSESLAAGPAPAQSSYYRRKVTELNSGSVGYSDVACVFIVNQPADSSGFNIRFNIDTANSAYICSLGSSTFYLTDKDKLYAKNN